MWSQLLGTFPAPLFLFLAGVSFALVTDKLLQKDLPAGQIAKTTIRRGAEIFALGLLFRLQEYVIAWGWAPWSDLLRVDILNTIGLSMMLMGLVSWIVLACGTGRPRPVRTGVDARLYTNLATVAIFVAAAIAAFAPLLWTTWRPRFLPWPVESYINGVHNLGSPQAWLFPVFPWTAFAFAGLAFGFVLLSDTAKKLGARAFLIAAVVGIVLIYGAKFLDSRSLQIYPVYDYWHTSPNFFMIRLGLLLLLVVSGYAWCRWGLGQRGFSPLIQLGRTSLLVYWVHIEFVYGRFSILPKGRCSIWEATAGLVIIFLAMLALSVLRTRWKKRQAKALRASPGPAAATAESG
jgi:uncharacterized membrane protein